MAQLLAGAVRDTAQLIPEFSMSGAAGGRPFAPVPEATKPRDAKPVANVRMWDESTLWLIARHADRRTLLGGFRVGGDDHFGSFPHVTERRERIAKIRAERRETLRAPVRRTVVGPIVDHLPVGSATGEPNRPVPTERKRSCVWNWTNRSASRRGSV
jgi:hypothetical protein